MKKLISTLCVTALTMTFASASVTPEILLSEADIEIITVEALDIFTSTSFDTETENIVFDTKKVMSVVQIFNANNELQFQLPVMSNNVQINKNLFESGANKLGFILDGDTRVYFTAVKIK